MGNLKVLDDKKLLDLSQLNGDGTNAAAKKGAIKLATVDIKTKKAQKT
jgi:hypothetical protein